MPKIFLVAEHCGKELKKFLIDKASQSGVQIVDLYPVYNPDDDYPTVAKILATKLKTEPKAIGIAMCGSGQGINMCLNRFYFIRSALVTSKDLAKQAREHGASNVITFGTKYIQPEEAWECLQLFLSVEPSQEERHIRRTSMFGTKSYSDL
jgi:ribose 5-phosphate isomerase B